MEKLNVSINHIAVYVSNIAVSTQFYKEVLGLTSIPEPFKLGRHSWFQVGPGCQLHLISGLQNQIKTFFDNHLAFSTTAFKAFVTILQQKNITYWDAAKNQNTIQVRPDGVKQVFFQDPDGYWLEVNNSPTT